MGRPLWESMLHSKYSAPASFWKKRAMFTDVVNALQALGYTHNDPEIESVLTDPRFHAESSRWASAMRRVRAKGRQASRGLSAIGWTGVALPQLALPAKVALKAAIQNYETPVANTEARITSAMVALLGHAVSARIAASQHKALRLQNQRNVLHARYVGVSDNKRAALRREIQAHNAKLRWY